MASVLCVAIGCADLPDAQAPDAGSYASAAPCELGQHWVLEGESLVVALVCADGQAIDAADVELVNAPDGVKIDREHGELRWTPSLDQAANYQLELLLPKHRRAELRIGVADRFEDPDNVPVVDPLRYTHELGLPVFHLGVAEGINDEDYTPASLTYTGHEYAGPPAKYRGATSQTYPKRSFTLKLAKDARFSDKARGFPSARRVVLTSTFDDTSQIRQRLAFELWNRLDPEHIPIRHFNAVVYLNGHYHGVYVATEHVNDDFMEQLGFPADVNIYKARLKECNFRLTDRAGAPKKLIRAGYTKEEGSPPAGEPEAYKDLEELITWVATSDDEDFRDNFWARLSPDFVNWFTLVTLSAAVDTTTKNYFLVHDTRADAPDPHWRLIPWNFNASFGQSYRTARRGPEMYEVANMGRSNRLFERVLGDPSLRAQLMQRFQNSVNALRADEISLTLERYASEVGAAAERDELRWNAAFRAYFNERSDFISHREEIDYLRAWIPVRWSTIADQLDK